MLEREVRRKYLQELGGSLVLYAIVLTTALHVGKGMQPGAARTLLLLLPLIPVVLAVAVVARQFRRMDEFIRLRSLESIAVGAAVTAGWTLTYGFLEMVGFPRLSMFWVWPVMGICWAGHSAVRALLAR